VGPVTLLSGDTISVGESAMRSLLIAAYITVSLLGLSAIGLLISTFTDVPVGAMAATIVLSVVSQVLDNLPQLEWLHPWLFSHHWLGFADLLRPPVSWTSFGENALLQAGTSPCAARWPTPNSPTRTSCPSFVVGSSHGQIL
jgi:ABC-2 type transport system permease protein